MPSPRLIAVVTALTWLSSGSAAFAAYTLEQLRVIEGLINSKDCGALRGYVLSNPGLLQGSDPLARELRIFVTDVNSGLFECLSAPAPAIGPTVNVEPELLY